MPNRFEEGVSYSQEGENDRKPNQIPYLSLGTFLPMDICGTLILFVVRGARKQMPEFWRARCEDDLDIDSLIRGLVYGGLY